MKKHFREGLEKRNGKRGLLSSIGFGLIILVRAGVMNVKLTTAREWWWHKWLTDGILSGQVEFKSQDGLRLFQYRIAVNLFSLADGLFLKAFNRMLHFFFPVYNNHLPLSNLSIIIYRCTKKRKKQILKEAGKGPCFYKKLTRACLIIEGKTH